MHKRQNKSYKLLPYDPDWVREFSEVKARITPIYGNNLLDIQHVGSTAVPGMLAKPQIDVCVIVESIDEVTNIRPDFEALGFVAKGDYVGQDEEYFTYDDEAGERKYNVHTLQVGNPAIEGYLSFRDYLIAHPDARDEYIAIKEELRDRYGLNDYNSYDWNKEGKIESIKQEAKQWYRKYSNSAG